MANAFVVSPMKQEISLKPGDTYDGYVLVGNPADATEDFNFVATLNPFSVSGNDYRMDFETMSDWSKIVGWTKLEETSGTLAPNETKRVHFTITVPKDAPAGGQYLMLGISSKPSESGEGGVQDVVKMASLVYADIAGNTKHEGEIIKNFVPGFVASGVPITTVEVSNNGNVHEKLTTNLTVKNVFSGEKISLTGEDKDSYDSLVMPESTRVITRNIDGLPSLGIFEVTQQVNYSGKDSNITTIMVICPIWFIVLVVVLIASIIATVCFTIHSKRKKSNGELGKF